MALNRSRMLRRRDVAIGSIVLAVRLCVIGRVVPLTEVGPSRLDDFVDEHEKVVRDSYIQLPCRLRRASRR
jgi:hypothetical protein